MIDRPHIRETTAGLQSLVDRAANDFVGLHPIYVELLFRERKAARLLRQAVGDQLAQMKGYFPWPSTAAPGGSGELDEAYFQYSQGILGLVGYRVGANGVSFHKRRELLSHVFGDEMPSVNSETYMSAWGRPKTAKRLEKLARSIAAFARHAKRRNARGYSAAITEWESDLAYLKRAYYEGKYSFPWPRKPS